MNPIPTKVLELSHELNLAMEEQMSAKPQSDNSGIMNGNRGGSLHGRKQLRKQPSAD
jgi:hypothetical protein